MGIANSSSEGFVLLRFSADPDRLEGFDVNDRSPGKSAPETAFQRDASARIVVASRKLLEGPK